MASKYFKKALSEANPASQAFIHKNLDITEQIYDILDRQGKSQKDLATALGKTEAEISRLLSGLHNFTLKTIAKLETALREDIILTPLKAQQASIDSPVLSFSKTAQHQATAFSFSGKKEELLIRKPFTEAKIIFIDPKKQHDHQDPKAI